MKTADKRLDELLGWLGGDGVAVAKRTVRRYGLPNTSAEDVVQDAFVRAWRMVAKAAPDDTFVAPAIGTRLIQRGAVDLLRSTMRQPALLPEQEDEDDDALSAVAVDEAPLPEDVVAQAHEEDALRQVVFASTAKPEDVAAALALLTLTFHPEPDLREIPRPKAGAALVTERGWVALHFAGRRDCFPSSAGRGAAAVTKRRERAIAAAYALLQRAVSLAMSEGDTR